MKIVLLSDGTGNGAAKRHRTNVWRLYHALDVHREDQIAFYDDGVGSQEFWLFKILGGAFGWGLQSNVIELYKTLCRTYKDCGDDIYLFRVQPRRIHSPHVGRDDRPLRAVYKLLQ